MSAGSAERTGRAAPRREMVLLLVLGAAGAGLALLALRQGWAQVRTHAPSPLPDSVTTETGQALVPAAGALALAALAGLAAVLATRGVLRRIAGVVLAGFGVGIAVTVSAGISAASVLATASASAQARIRRRVRLGRRQHDLRHRGRGRRGGVTAVRVPRPRGVRELSLARGCPGGRARRDRGRGRGDLAGAATAGDVRAVRGAGAAPSRGRRACSGGASRRARSAAPRFGLDVGVAEPRRGPHGRRSQLGRGRGAARAGRGGRRRWVTRPGPRVPGAEAGAVRHGGDGLATIVGARHPTRGGSRTA